MTFPGFQIQMFHGQTWAMGYTRIIVSWKLTENVTENLQLMSTEITGKIG